MTVLDVVWDSEAGQLVAEDPDTGERKPVPFDEIDVNNASVGSFSTGVSRTNDARITSRINPVFVANQIRQSAGIPAHEEVGVRSGKTAGLSDPASVSSSADVTIDSESTASTESDGGSGTESDPYLFENRQFSINWYGSGDYHIELRNCELTGGGDGSYQARMDNTGNTTLTISNCKIYDQSGETANPIVHSSGDVIVEETLFAGSGDEIDANAGSEDTLTLRDCRVDDSEKTWSGRFCQMLRTGHIEMRYCEVVASVSTGITQWNDCSGTVTNSLFDSINSPSALRFSDTSPGVADGWVIEYNEFRDCRAVRGRPLTNSEIRYCYFNDSPAGDRQVRIDTGDVGISENVEVHHNRFDKPTGTNSPGNECCESFNSKNIDFHHNWVEQCPEDAFEHVNSNGNCHVRHCVGDNVTGQIVDYFGNGDGGAGTDYSRANRAGSVEHIYGNCGDAAVILDDVSGIRVKGHIYAEAGESGLLLRQRNASPGEAPNDCKITGPLPHPESVDNVFTASGDLGSDNWAMWWDGEEIQTYDPDNNIQNNWTNVR